MGSRLENAPRRGSEAERGGAAAGAWGDEELEQLGWERGQFISWKGPDYQRVHWGEVRPVGVFGGSGIESLGVKDWGVPRSSKINAILLSKKT